MHLDFGERKTRESCLWPVFMVAAVVIEPTVGVMVIPLGNIIKRWDLWVMIRTPGQGSLDCD